MMENRRLFLGFFPKKTYLEVASLEIPGIIEVCSVSNCISDGPENWLHKWEHNDVGFFDTEIQAESILPNDDKNYEMYAYEVFHFRCISGKIEPNDLKGLQNGVPDNYVFLEYDIVTKTLPNSFECSPLSCNYLGKEFPVNKRCLIENFEDAVEVYREICEKSLGEPGPYYLFAVHRKHA